MMTMYTAEKRFQRMRTLYLLSSARPYRNWKYEQELQSLLWKIDSRDLSLIQHTSQHVTSFPCTLSTIKVSRVMGQGQEWGQVLIKMLS